MTASAPPTGLPAEEVVDDVRRALTRAGAAVLQAPPGAGKTTVIPLRLLDEAWLSGQRIVMLEPRRLAARAAARRMAELLGDRVGGLVGYRTRDESVVSERTRIEVVTEGILVRRIQRDPSLEGTGLVILDEVHERNIHTDVALALLLDAREAFCPAIRLLAMSATLDSEPLARLLTPSAANSSAADLSTVTPARSADSPGSGMQDRPDTSEHNPDHNPDPNDAVPVITSDGRAHPVEVRWIPGQPRERLDAHVARAVATAVRAEPGDVLVFLPGAAEIRRVASALGRSLGPDVDIRPLYGALDRAEQDRALAPSPPGRRRVVLATDIAESSLTVAGVRVVVDAGRARVPRLDPRRGMTTLVTVAASKASADQRAGRAGRLGPGVAYRLWSEAEHVSRPRFAAPEITQTDLAPLALDLARWGASADDLRWLDPPPTAALAEAHALLEMLGLVDADHRLTESGRRAARLPLHPRLARMVVDAEATDRWAACLLAVALDEQDVFRGRPGEVSTDAAERLRVLADRHASHPSADGGRVAAARRRAERLARRAQVRATTADPTHAGPTLGLAYPDRLAQQRRGRHLRLRNGMGASIPEGDPLAGEPFVVVADLDWDERDADGRVRIAAALDRADVERLGGDGVVAVTEVVWDDERNDLRVRTESRLGALVLDGSEGPATSGAATAAALTDRVRRLGLDTLTWSDAARAVQARATFARAEDPDGGWPAVDDDSLSAELDQWLEPLLIGARGRRDLESLDLVAALRARLGYPWAQRLSEAAPTEVTLASGRTVKVRYDSGRPTIATRAQDLYGTTVHPRVGGGPAGGVPVVVEVLSPAGRPVQVTSDLPGFWAGSWAEVRKEMAGRYPKHHWPADPVKDPRR